jgi:hypothetical protein
MELCVILQRFLEYDNEESACHDSRNPVFQQLRQSVQPCVEVNRYAHEV